MANDLMTHHETPCSSSTAAAGLERTRFYPRQLVGADDLTQDQRYFRDKHRRHNRMLHGWGVVCGAVVRPNRINRCEVFIEQGYILGPHGDEIVIPEAVTFDICKQGVAEQMGCCPETEDPWCADPRGRCPEGRFFLAVRYAECPSRPVRSGGCGCGCDGEACEYSRVRDSFALKVLTELPPGYTTPMQQPPLPTLMPCQNRTGRQCPPCADSPWVILADILIGPNCQVLDVDSFSHRRYVLSFANYYFVCAAQLGTGVRVDTGVGSYSFISSLSGGTDLMDMAMSTTSTTPRAMVTMARSDGGSVAVPAFFAVTPGTTVAELLDREGDRGFFDPITNSTLTLRELYAHADVDPATVLDSTAAALAPLEGRTLNVADVRASRAVLEESLHPSALERLDREFTGAPARAGALPATSIAGVEASSTLARSLGSRTIDSVAKLSRDEFISATLRGAPAGARTELEEEAGALWEAAQRVVKIRGTPS